MVGLSLHFPSGLPPLGGSVGKEGGLGRVTQPQRIGKPLILAGFFVDS